MIQLGNLDFNARNYGKAAEAYRAALQLDKSSADCWYNLGLVEEQLHHDDDAREAFEQALILKPGDKTFRAALMVLQQRIK